MLEDEIFFLYIQRFFHFLKAKMTKAFSMNTFQLYEKDIFGVRLQEGFLEATRI